MDEDQQPRLRQPAEAVEHDEPVVAGLVLLEEDLQVMNRRVGLAHLDLAQLQRLVGLALQALEVWVDLVAVRVELVRVQRRDAERIN